MRLISMAMRDELVVAIAERYADSLRGEKARILDEFVAVTGYHRSMRCGFFVKGQLASGPARGRPAGSMTRRFGRRWLSSGKHPTASAASG